MKKMLMVFFMLVAAMTTNIFANETITLAIGDWAPYTSQKDKKGKISEVIVSEAFTLENIVVKLEYYPWIRSYLMTTQGDVAGTFPWFYNDKRNKETIYNKEPLIAENEVIFHLKSLDFKWKDFSDLKNYIIGGTIGYNHNVILAEHGIKTDQVNSDLLNFKKLLKGRIDLFPVSYNVGYYILNKSFSPELAANVTNQPKAIQEGKMFVLFSKKIPNGQALADKFDIGLKKLKASGRYAQILTQFTER